MKNVILLCLIILVAGGCKNEPSSTENDIVDVYQNVSGETMGTTYHISYQDSFDRNYQDTINRLLEAVNMGVSTYIPESEISLFNGAEKSREFRGRMALVKGRDVSGLAKSPQEHFIANFLISRTVAEGSAYFFDPTVMPLVNYWGFGYTPKKPITQIDSITVDSLLKGVGFEKLSLGLPSDTVLILQKGVPGIQLDFSAVAKGYGVDEVARFLEAQGVKNYLVEIGGEVRAKGNNPKSQAWTIGINKPEEGAPVSEFSAYAVLKDKALATSGNYRNFYEVDGQKFSHTINPKTGFPERSRLLSTSVFAPDCAMADALATACMVLGLRNAKTLLGNLPGVEGLFLHADENGVIQQVTTADFPPDYLAD